MSTSGNSNQFHPTNGFRCKYLRNRHGNPIGLIMTKVQGDQLLAGWSLCNRKLDVFRKSEARRMAAERLAPIETSDGSMLSALEHFANSTEVPDSVSRGCRHEIAYRNQQAQWQFADEVLGRGFF